MAMIRIAFFHFTNNICSDIIKPQNEADLVTNETKEIFLLYLSVSNIYSGGSII